MNSIVFSVPLREQGAEVAMEEAERLVGPLKGLYGRSQHLLGYEAIKVWIQMADEGPRLNIYLETRGPIHDTLEAGMRSDRPMDLQLKSLFEMITGSTWDDIVGQMVYSILDWQAAPRRGADDRQEEI